MDAHLRRNPAEARARIEGGGGFLRRVPVLGGASGIAIVWSAVAWHRFCGGPGAGAVGAMSRPLWSKAASSRRTPYGSGFKHGGTCSGYAKPYDSAFMLAGL